MTRKSGGKGKGKAKSLDLKKQTVRNLSVPETTGADVKGGLWPTDPKPQTITCKGGDCKSYQCFDTIC